MDKVNDNNDKSEKSLEDLANEIPEDFPDVSATENMLTPQNEQQELSLIKDEVLLGIYGEIMDNLREDRDQASDLSDTFSNMVVNDGDSSTSSKEALVNLVKAKIDASDKMAKIADLMTRIKLKQPDTFKPYMKKEGYDNGAQTINIYDSGGFNKRSLMESIQNEQEGKGK